jgi:hypothetical protein
MDHSLMNYLFKINMNNIIYITIQNRKNENTNNTNNCENYFIIEIILETS